MTGRQQAHAELRLLLHLIHDPANEPALRASIRVQIALQAREAPCDGGGDIGYYRCECRS